MDKNEKTLRKLLSILPEDQKQAWKFDAENVGSSMTSGYGIRGENTSVGISVDCHSSFRHSWMTDHEDRMNDTKLGNVLAAYVAACSPVAIEALLLEVEQLRDQVGSLEFAIEKTRGQS